MNPRTPEPKQTALLLRPHVFFPVLLVLVAISVLLTPQSETSQTAPNLTSRSAAPNGAKGLAQTLRRLGWSVSETVEPMSDADSPDDIYAVLVPTRGLTEVETHTLLNRVRAGAGVLILVNGGALADSLHIDRGPLAGVLNIASGDSASCPAPRRSLADLATRLPLIVSPVKPTGPITHDTTHIATLRSVAQRDSLRHGTQAAALGIQLGKGRLVAVADGRMLTNDVVRVCHWGAAMAAVRSIEWLSVRDGEAPRRNIVFDEFHQGYGRHASAMAAVFTWLGTTTPGRTTTQLIIAALLLLAANAPRAIAPLPRKSIPRRSPLEHVSALAQAYEQVKGTRTAARLLVQGLRRRAAPATGARRNTDEGFLNAVAARFPSLKSDTDRARHAMLQPVPPAELIEVANTIDRIERSVRP